MNLNEVYRAYGEDSEVGVQARLLLGQQHWYASIAEFDPRTGDALPLAFDDVVHRLATRAEFPFVRDRLWRIVDHCRLSLEHIFGSLSENPRREQAYLPIRDVKELNASSFMALSRRPGRNVREKLAGKPYMQAVRRYQSVDLPQNRLVKEFVTQLADLLELRRKYLGHEDDLLGDIHRWLRTDEAQAIGHWDNLPPNNTLLSHRDYRRVWDAWRWLQVLDDALARDMTELDFRTATVEKWENFGRSYAAGSTLFGDMPVLFNYDNFTIETWQEPVLRPTDSTARPNRERTSAEGPICVDLTYLRPRFATAGSKVSLTLPETYLWQRWQRGSDAVDLELFNADIALLHPDATSISTTDLFFSQKVDQSLLDWAAHAFARQLSRTFSDSTLIWLIPDFLNDFQLQVARRNINARFAKAEPLPRSVAAVFEQIDHAKVKGNGFQVVVVDQIGGTTYATKLIARHDAALQERLPETHGYYWERSPHVTLQHDAADYDALAEIPRIDKDGQWNDQESVMGRRRVSEEALRRHPQIGQFDTCITVPESPVSGGARFHELQVQAGDIPLWRDHIPELSIKVIRDRRYERFFLVDRDTTIHPIRGVAVPIPVEEQFTLPAGKAYFQFPLFQGQNPDDLGYVARLESPAFPLATDTTCRLKMTYTYGADDPYHLVFEPLNGLFKPIQVKWRPKTKEIVTDAPAPGYPTPLTWDELQTHYNAERGAPTDFLDWATQKTKELVDKLFALDNVVHGKIKTDWKTNANGWHYTFANCDTRNDLYIHEKDLPDGVPYDTFSRGDDAFFVVVHRHGRDRTEYVSKSREDLRATASRDLASSIRRALYVPYIRVWSDGRSLSDPDCPDWFRNEFGALLPKLEVALHSADTPLQVKKELMFLFSCMHRDMPVSISRELQSQNSVSVPDNRAYAFALGDLTSDWQYDSFLAIRNRNDLQMLSILAQAIWRSDGFVKVFDRPALEELGETLIAAMRQSNAVKHPSKTDISRLTRYCELLLGLLRSRDSHVPDTRLTFQPNQKLTEEFAEEVSSAIALIDRSGFEVRSRVEVADLPEKPADDSTPDLLHALRLYLTGDVGSYAIRVTGVTNSEDD